ncbi:MULTISPECIES: GNAT family N-acetyltransferase [Paraburkholderia]|uniref:GNAT family N-acetyltransferase n=1 Tax=Paraburkholderia TaxID=1822464 RepID=UPI0004813B52|nr:GNAT family N-acetyltransferase [Paraburkholderia ferrariae]
MRLVKPLDRQSLIRIPSALEGKFYLGGPYEFDSLLREPGLFGDEDVDWRPIQIAQPNGEPVRLAQVDVASGLHDAKVAEWPGFPTEVRYRLRYLYRDSPGSAILGVVELKVSHKVLGVQNRFATECTKVIHTVYVTPSSRGKGIARILLAEVLSDAPDVHVHPQFSEEGARLFGFDLYGNRA